MTFETILATPDLHPDLESCRVQLVEIQERASRLFADLSDEQLRWQPAPDRWSITLCLAHCNSSGYELLPRIRQGIDRGHRKGWMSKGPYRYGALSNWFVRSMEPPPKRRIGSPRMYLPPSDPGPPREVVTEFLKLQSELVRMLRRAHGVDLARVKITSPVTRLLRMSLGQWFRFLAAHERRHLWQAEQVTREVGFP